MGSAAFIASFIFTAIGSLIFSFPIAALTIKSHIKINIGWKIGLKLFGITVAVVAAINFLLYVGFEKNHEATYRDSLSLFSMLQNFIIPLIVSLAILYKYLSELRESTANRDSLETQLRIRGIRFEDGKYRFGKYLFEDIEYAINFADNNADLKGNELIKKEKIKGAFKLDSSTKRTYFLAAPAGVTLILLTYIFYSLNHSYPGFTDAIFSNSIRFRSYMFFTLAGCALILSGIIFSFFYDQTIGKLRNWIANGNE